LYVPLYFPRNFSTSAKFDNVSVFIRHLNYAAAVPCEKKLSAEIGTNFTANAEKLEFFKQMELVLTEFEKNVFVFGSSLAAVTFDNVTAS